MSFVLIGALAVAGLFASEGCVIELGETNARRDGGGDAPEEGDAGRETGPDSAFDASAGCKGFTSTDSNLVGYYPFDDTDGVSVADCSGKGNHGVASSPLSHEAGHFGTAASLDGNTCIDLGNPALFAFQSGKFTIAAWIHPRAFDSNSNPTIFFSRLSASNPSTGFSAGFHAPHSFQFSSYTATGLLNQAEAIVRDEDLGLPMIHVVGLYGGSHQEVFIQGQPRHDNNSITPIVEITDAHVWVGCRTPGIQNFDGMIDELRIYSRELALDEVPRLFVQTKP